jgi:hypothetical protein
MAGEASTLASMFPFPVAVALNEQPAQAASAAVMNHATRTELHGWIRGTVRASRLIARLVNGRPDPL